jgi:hypothetical protein
MCVERSILPQGLPEALPLDTLLWPGALSMEREKGRVWLSLSSTFVSGEWPVPLAYSSERQGIQATLVQQQASTDRLQSSIGVDGAL